MNHSKNQRRNRLQKGRHSIQGAYYFLTTVTSNRKPILSNSEMGQLIFQAFEWLEAQNRINWICIMIMPDHVHVVLQLGHNQTLPKVMHSLKSFTAKQINKQRSETGSVWQDGYYEHGIRGDESLNEIIRYCYENPVRKGLVERAIDYPYWWCKFRME